jgi:tRNA(adenine34) deaminase
MNIEKLVTNNDEQMIRRCIELSEEAVRGGDKPFGALIAKENNILVESTNDAESKVPYHAEIITLMAGQEILNTNDLSGYSLYSNCEPCPMCSFMIREYKLDKVVFSVHSPYMGGQSRWNILEDDVLTRFKPYFSKPPEVVGGVLESEGKKIFDEVGLWMFGKDQEI